MDKINLIRNLNREAKLTRKKVEQIKRDWSKEIQKPCPTNIELLHTYRTLVSQKKIKASEILERFLCTRAVRTLSGVAIVSVLMKPHPCPGDCLFCPTDSTVPKSYSPNEPAVMRALLCDFDPYKQVTARIASLQKTGHDTSKCELIIIGATFSGYPKIYQNWFIKRCFDGFNGRNYSTLGKSQKANEKAKNRCIGMSVENRPDTIDETEIKRLRELGVTRIELGVQHTSNKVLDKNNRQHTIKQTIEATKLLKNSGFKINYHMMPGLYGSDDRQDLAMFKELFSNPDFQPDMLKIYPCVVTRNSKLYKLWQQKKYKAPTEKRLLNLITKIKAEIPPYGRIVRLIRDIPAHEIAAGSKMTNMRQILQQKKVKCLCIRCREAKEEPAKLSDIKLVKQKYKASDSLEYFLSFDSTKGKLGGHMGPPLHGQKLFAFLRLRLPDQTFIPELKDAALIREVHTYGKVVPVGAKKRKASQHLGLGRKLMTEAEKIARQAGYNKMAVISGIGVRGYYRKLGYRLQGTYMIKRLNYD